MTAQTPATAEMKKWLRIRVRKKNAESCRESTPATGSSPTSAFNLALHQLFHSSVPARKWKHRHGLANIAGSNKQHGRENKNTKKLTLEALFRSFGARGRDKHWTGLGLDWIGSIANFVAFGLVSDYMQLF